MLWTVWKAFGWRFALENWVMGHFWKWYFRNDKEIYQQKLEEQVKHMLQRWYLAEKQGAHDHELVVVAVISSWIVLRAYPDDQIPLVRLMKTELKKKVMWLESGL